MEPIAKPTLVYPFAAPPEPGTSLEVVPGVRWLRMPMPYALNHINLWAIDDITGWTLVDTGLRTEETADVWRGLLANASDRRPVNRVLVTHMHPDHVGMAGWLTRKFDCRLWMTRLEYLNCRVLISDTGREAPPDAERFYRRAGWGEAPIENSRSRFAHAGKQLQSLPDSYRRIGDGEQIRIGRHDWRVVVGNGHSPEHACFYCPELKLLISGDQVLPRISSNISVYPLEPDANPMADWFASLAKLKREVPDDVLVLPAHNECFRGLHARLDYLAASQHAALDRLRQALVEPKRAIDVFASLFGRPIVATDAGLLGLATGESLACLNFLVEEGAVGVREDNAGVAWYVAEGPPEAVRGP